MVKPGRFGLSSRSSIGSALRRRLAAAVVGAARRRESSVRAAPVGRRRCPSSRQRRRRSAGLVVGVARPTRRPRRRVFGSSSLRRRRRPRRRASGVGASRFGVRSLASAARTGSLGRGGGSRRLAPPTTVLARSPARRRPARSAPPRPRRPRSRRASPGPFSLVPVPERVLAPAGEVRLEVVGPDEVLDVQERGPLEPDVDERGLQPGQDPRHLAEVDVAYGAAERRGAAAFDVELGDDAVLDEGDACLGDVARDDEDVLGHVERSFPARRQPAARRRRAHGPIVTETVTGRGRAHAKRSNEEPRATAARPAGAAAGQETLGRRESAPSRAATA